MRGQVTMLESVGDRGDGVAGDGGTASPVHDVGTHHGDVVGRRFDGHHLGPGGAELVDLAAEVMTVPPVEW